jgi:hypothetical protein
VLGDVANNDYYEWTPEIEAFGAINEHCVLGQQTFYLRKSSCKKCINSYSYEVAPGKQTPCNCFSQDFAWFEGEWFIYQRNISHRLPQRFWICPSATN